MRPSAEGESRNGDDDVPGVFAGHALAYAELITALTHAWQRAMQRKALGVALAGLGFSVLLLLLTVTIVADAWDTPNRWPVIIAVSAVYLAVGSWGIWLLTRPPLTPPPLTVLASELRKDVTLFSAAMRRRRDENEEDAS
jgi:uncharacterized membrane protein YqjE